MARSPVPKVTEHGITVVFEAENPTIEYVPPLPVPHLVHLETTIHGFWHR